MKLCSRRALWRLAILFVVLGLALGWGYLAMVDMPGTSYRGPLDAPTDAQRDLAARLRTHVEVLAGDCAGRGVSRPRDYVAAAEHIESHLRAVGLSPRREVFLADGHECFNIIAEVSGGSPEMVVIGAHYDAFDGMPGADDNASGAAGVLELARHFAGRPQPRTLRFVLFANEEPPFFTTPDMGSMVHAKAARASSENITSMLCLEMIGYYSDEPGSQNFPSPLAYLYPSTGDFIAFVGDYANRGLVRRAIGTFRDNARFPSEGGALPSGIPGIGWSDHASFWQFDYPAIMVTDTAHMRNPHYHTPGDTPGTLDYDRMARVVEGLTFVVADFATR